MSGFMKNPFDDTLSTEASAEQDQDPFLGLTEIKSLSALKDLKKQLHELKEVKEFLQLDFPGDVAGLISEYFSGKGGISDLLKYVAEGEQEKAEVLVTIYPELLLKKGTVADLSGREFKDITAFQYAVWALDWHMWRMLLQYLGEIAASQQLRNWNAMETYSHGQHASWQGLIDAYAHSIRYSSTDWIQQIGRAQRLLPAHVANEYCHKSRSFNPLPDFASEAVKLTRSRLSGNTMDGTKVDWYDKSCGVEWWHYRGHWRRAETHHFAPGRKGASSDREAVAALLKTRKKQRADLEKRLSLVLS